MSYYILYIILHRSSPVRQITRDTTTAADGAPKSQRLPALYLTITCLPTAFRPCPLAQGVESGARALSLKANRSKKQTRRRRFVVGPLSARL